MPVRKGVEILLEDNVSSSMAPTGTFPIASFNIQITIKSDEPSIVSIGKPEARRQRDDVF